jgi:hypothetical protein
VLSSLVVTNVVEDEAPNSKTEDVLMCCLTRAAAYLGEGVVIVQYRARVEY